MAFNPYQFYSQFKEDVGYKGEINKQIAECRAALNDGDIYRIRNTAEVISFVMITPKMMDDEYNETRKNIDDELKKYRAKKDLEYKIKYDKAFNKSCIVKPKNIAPRWYYELIIKNAIALLERRKLLLKESISDRSWK